MICNGSWILSHEFGVVSASIYSMLPLTSRNRDTQPNHRLHSNENWVDCFSLFCHLWCGHHERFMMSMRAKLIHFVNCIRFHLNYYCLVNLLFETPECMYSWVNRAINEVKSGHGQALVGFFSLSCLVEQ